MCIASFVLLLLSSAIAEQSLASSITEKKLKTVFVTGVTGVMGHATLLELLHAKEELHIKALARDTRKNHRMLSRFSNYSNLEVIWGDFLDYDTVLNCVTGSDYVLHIGGLVSPAADTRPFATEKVNVGSTRNIVRAVLAQPNADEIKVAYIGSVAETGDRNSPVHWGRTGDPISVSVYDHYGISKIIAEQILVESGIKNWVVLRQSGILHAGLMHHLEPIVFHVPLNGVLEWATVEDSGRLMANLVTTDLPKEFWCRYYNIGSGEQYRLTNYQFETLLLGALGLGPIETLFDPHWFSTQNFHGQFYADGDVLESFLHFRYNVPVLDYFEYLAQQCEFYFRIPRIVPFKGLMGAVAKPFMKMIASTRVFGTLDWAATNNTKRLTAYFGSPENFWKQPRSWDEFQIASYNTSNAIANEYILDHGYDESKPLSEIDIEDVRQAAKFRGGEVISKTMTKGDLTSKLAWKCGHCGHVFFASPNLILLGGHWCPHCMIPTIKWDYDAVAESNPFFAQVWRPFHKEGEHHVYYFDDLFKESAWNKD